MSLASMHRPERPSSPSTSESGAGARFRLAVMLATLLAIAPLGLAFGYWRVSEACTEYAEQHGLRVAANRWWRKNNTCELQRPDGSIIYPNHGIVWSLTTTAGVVAIWLAGAGIWILLVRATGATRR